jgi:hypothetical protein
MIKYAQLINEETGLCSIGTGTNIDFYKSIGMTELDVQQSDIDNNWYLIDKCPMKTDEQKEQEEKKRVAMLRMTPRDFLLAITGMGVDFTKIKELMATNPQVEIELNYCNYVYRGNALLDKLCGQFGITTTQLDELFKSKGTP